jgi:hypothetical protein
MMKKWVDRWIDEGVGWLCGMIWVYIYVFLI